MPAASDPISSYLRRLSTSVERPAKRRVLDAAGKAGVKAANSAIAGTLGGDGAFSRWTTKKPIPLKTKAFAGHGDTVTIGRDRPSAGPMRVAEDGRNQGSASGFHGPGINRKTGATSRTKAGVLRKVRTARKRRSNGKTGGFGVWTTAAGAAAGAVPKAAWEQQRAEFGRAIKGGR